MAKQCGNAGVPSASKVSKQLRFALERHDHFLVRYAVRALLMRDVAFEEDPEFKMRRAESR